MTSPSSHFIRTPGSRSSSAPESGKTRASPEPCGCFQAVDTQSPPGLRSPRNARTKGKPLPGGCTLSTLIRLLGRLAECVLLILWIVFKN